MKYISSPANLTRFTLNSNALRSYRSEEKTNALCSVQEEACTIRNRDRLSREFSPWIYGVDWSRTSFFRKRRKSRWRFRRPMYRRRSSLWWHELHYKQSFRIGGQYSEYLRCIRSSLSHLANNEISWSPDIITSITYLLYIFICYIFSTSKNIHPKPILQTSLIGPTFTNPRQNYIDRDIRQNSSFFSPSSDFSQFWQKW